jgi:hypothetical protein
MDSVMENFIGWMLMLLIPVVTVFVVVRGIKYFKLRRERKAQKIREELEQAKARAKQVKEEWRQKLRGATHIGNTRYDYHTDTSTTVVKNQATGSRVSYVHTRDDGPDILTTLIVADLLNNNKSSSSGTVNWNNDIPSIEPEERKSSSSSWSSSSSDDIGSSSSWDSSSSSSSSSSWD